MDERVRVLNSRPIRAEAKYVLYWPVMNRRVESNHALAHAAGIANSLGLPLLVYEGLTCSYPWANDRIHTFLLEGVPETARRLRKLGIGYVFHPRRRARDPNDQLYRLANDAAAVVVDDYPAFLASAFNQSVPGRLDAACHAVDSSCVIPMNLLDKKEYAAYTIRPKIRRMLAEHLRPAPAVSVIRPYNGAAPDFHIEVREDNIAELVSSCEIDHSIRPSLTFRGGRVEAEKHLARFLTRNLRRYAKERNEPAAHATSDLSPYLHFGQISSLEVALAVRDYAAGHKLIAHEFLEELIVRRELAFNHARHSAQPASFAGLPRWAANTMRAHDGDRRDWVYTRAVFESAGTHDPLWNAAQREMLLRGKIHGYYRMYWGKKIIEWSASHQDALDTMVYLHDRYALDGRDPNTYANILWCFGLHDRPWAERPVFGMLRYMSYDGMRRKTDIEAYIREIDHLERTGHDPFRVV